MKFLFVGHSHTVCLVQAALEMGIPHKVVRLNNVASGAELTHQIKLAAINLTGGLSLDSGLPKYLEKHDIKTVLSVGGNYHNVIGLLKPPSPFDFVFPAYESLPLDEQAQLIPYDVLLDSVYQKLRPGFLTILYVKNLSEKNVIHVESPPPINNDEFIARNLDPYFQQKIADSMPELVPACVRFKLWRLCSDLYAKFCVEADVPYISTPVPLENGMFLSPEYYTTNATHANAAFGKQFLLKITRHFEGN